MIRIRTGSTDAMDLTSHDSLRGGSSAEVNDIKQSTPTTIPLLVLSELQVKNITGIKLT